MKYNLNNYIIFEIDQDNAVVQNQDGILQVQDEEMVSFLKYLDENNRKEITKVYLEEIFRDRLDEATEFLTLNRIIEEKKVINLEVMTICIYGDDEFISNLIFSSLFEKYGHTLTVIQKPVQDISEEVINNELAIVILTSYNRARAKKIRDIFMNQTHSILSMNYYYNGNFYMDNLYNLKWRNPCHICNIGQIESQLRVNNHNGISYQQMIDLLYSEYEDICIESPMLISQKINIASNILRLQYDFINDGNYSLFHPQNMNEVRMVDISSSKEYKDNALHWEMCDCYE